MDDFIDLDRQFIPFRDEASWELTYDTFFSRKLLGGESWSDLLKHRRVVILAEAGAGKTAEMKATARRLEGEGIFSLYATVNSVARRPLREAIASPAIETAFDLWLGGEDDGVLLLDSIDEARLDHQSFTDALSNVSRALGPNAARTTVVVSCRISDWRSLADRSDLVQRLGPPPNVPSRNERPEPGDSELLDPIFRDRSGVKPHEDDGASVATDFTPHIVALAPLSENQSRVLAQWAGAENVDRFLRAVRDADAGSLANRPQDLLGLVSLWMAEGRIGPKHEILLWSIQQRLRESNPEHARRDALSEGRAREGARTVAAALTLGRRRFVSWPIDPPQFIVDELAIHPADALPGWSPEEQRQLLNRAVFDAATVGRVRFHHRSVQEYLCAEWLLGLIESGCPVRRVWKIVAEERYGVTRLRPSLRPVAAWLAQHCDAIRHRVVAVAPELLIEGGDPSQLPIPTREALLDEFAERHKSRDDSGVSIGIDQVERLADAALVPKIRSLWELSESSGELRELLLRLIWAGRLDGCGDIALTAATSHARPYECALGSRALEAIGTQEQRRALAEHVIAHAASFPKTALAAALEAVFPSELSLEELEKLIRARPPESMDSLHSGLIHGLCEISRRADLLDVGPYVQTLQRLAMERPWIEGRRGRCSDRHRALLAPLMEVCARQIRQSGQSAVDPEVAEAAFFAGCAAVFLGAHQIDTSRKVLHDAVNENIGANRQQFWLSIEDTREEEGSLRGHYQAYAREGLWRLTDRDFDWLIADLKEKPTLNDREISLGAALSVWESSGRADEMLARIRAAIDTAPPLEEMLAHKLHPPEQEIDEDEEEWRRLQAEREVRRIEEQDAAKQSWRSFRDRLRANPDSLSVRSEADLYNLARWIAAKSKNDTTVFSHRTWNDLAPAFSSEVAHAARAGFIAFWRQYDPGMRRTRRRSVTGGAKIGLIGLAIEAAETPDWPLSLEPGEVAVATNYALLELNGFPEWAPALWTARTDVVEPILRGEIRWEFQQGSRKSHLHHVVARLAYSKEPLRSAAADWSLSELEATEPRADYSLWEALRTISGADVRPDSRLAALAARRFRSSRRTDRKLAWLSVWLGTSADPALDALDEWIKRSRNRGARDTLMLRLLNVMFEHREYRLGANLQDFRRFRPLTRLVRLAYAHVRREDDALHDGPYSPDARDDAETARGLLLEMLLDIPGEATYRELLAMSRETVFSSSHERMRVLADQRASAEADRYRWTPAQVANFGEQHRRLPRTLSDLHETILDRFWDIEDDLVSGRFVDKAALRQDGRKRAAERPVQLKIAEQLNLRAAGVYSVEREPEHSDRDRPDISVQRAGIEQPVPVEIKVADSWSWAQLQAALSEQLVSKYMRESASTHGHLVLTNHGKRGGWRLDRGEPHLGFSELVAALQGEADRLVADDPDIEKVSVTGIDLT